MTIAISTIAVYFLAMIVITILFISEYLVREDVIITKVMNYSESKVVKNMRIYFKK